MSTDKFHCPECRAPLVASPPDGLACEKCGTQVAIEDGILDFVRDSAGIVTDPGDYDAFHRIDDARSDARYRDIKYLAGEQWPSTLGSVLEVGCGTGLLSRALIRDKDAKDLMLTDVSLPMLRAARDHLDKAGLLSVIPLTFATHDGTEPCFRDGAFDTCAGTSVLHHIADVRGFLANVFRWLKPGGRAFFMEPNLRYHRALAQTLADILALLHGNNLAYSHGRQVLLNTIGQWRRGILHQGDLPFLATLEDKHMFASDAFEAMGRELGFASALAIPTASQPTGTGIVARLCTQLDVEQPVRAMVLGMLPAFASRYLSLLSPRDQSGSFLFWLEKGVGPVMRHFRAPPPPEPALPADTPEAYRTGGLPPRWSLELTASSTPDGIELLLNGWCLVNTDVTWVRISLDGVTQNAPVWLPRPDVQQAINAPPIYASWNALCCGVNETLTFAGARAGDGGLELAIEVVLANGTVLRVTAPLHLPLDDKLVVTQ